MRNLAAMLILVLVLGGFWYFHDIRGGNQKLEKELADKRVFVSMLPSDIKSVTWYGKDGPVVFQKDSLGWKAVLPDKHEMRVDSAVFNGLCVSLSGMNKVETISEINPSLKLAQFGLENPLYKMKMEYCADGQEGSGTLLLGNEAEDESGFYAIKEGEKFVIEVPGDFVQTLKLPLTELRSESTVPFAPGRISTLKYNSNQGTSVRDFEIAQQESRELDASEKKTSEDDADDTVKANVKWFVKNISSPEDFKQADVNKVNEFIWSLRTLKTVRCLHPDEKSKLGAVKASYSVTVGERKEKMELEFGQSVPGKEKCLYVHRTNPDEYLEVDYSAFPNGIKNLFGLTADDFADKHAADFSMENVNKFSVSVASKRPEGSYVVEARRIKGGWEIVKPEKAIHDEGKCTSLADDLLYSIADLQWTEEKDLSAVKDLPNCAEVSIASESENIKLEIKEVSDKYIAVRGNKAFLLSKDPRALWIKACEELDLNTGREAASENK